MKTLSGGRSIFLLALICCAGCGGSGNSGGDGGNGGGGSSGSGSGSGGPSGDDSGSAPDGSSAGDAASGTGGGDATVGDGGATNEGGGGGGGGSGDGAPSCSSGAGSTASQSGYVGDWAAGDYPPNFTAGTGNYLTISGVQGQMGNARQYAVHVPTGYDKTKPVPAVFCLHGLDQTALSFCTDEGVAWPSKGDQEGFVVIMPNGYQNSWNAGTCCGAAVTSGLDDVSLMRSIFTEVGTHVNIDLTRVYATGLSNGAYMSYRLACQASDLFVAVAPGSGAVGTAAIGGGTSTTSDLTSCMPTKKVSILDIHGMSDSFISYSVQKPSLAIFQGSDTCTTTTAPATVPPSGGDTTCVTFSGCAACPNVEVTGCSIADGGHCWFGSGDCGTGGGPDGGLAGVIGGAIVGNNSNFMKSTDQVWEFFKRLSR